MSRLKRPVVMTLAVFLTLACATPRRAEFMSCLEYGYSSRMYRQDSLQMIDPIGDAYLIRKLDTIPIKQFGYLFKEPLPQLRDEKVPFEIEKTLSIDYDRLLAKFGAVMRAHYPQIVPVWGEEHRWSPEAQQYLPFAFWHRLWRHWTGRQQDFPMPLFLRTKLFLCLACGWTSRYCVTGQEEALARRILSFPDRSVQIHQVFEESYVLNGGNLYLTFLTCENVLTGQPYRPQRGQDPLQQKLAYIRHDSAPLGDNYGAWYHLFGIALYGMLRAQWVSLTVADLESFGSLFYEGPDRQETLINRYGARLGHRFRKMVNEGTWLLPSPEIGADDYMLLR